MDFDDALSAKRVIFLHDVYGEEKSTGEIISEQMNELCRTAEETSEYIRLVNDHLDKQKLHVDDLKEMQKTFETQMTFLTSAKDPSEKKKTPKE